MTTKMKEHDQRKKEGRVYVLKANDTLSRISLEYYGISIYWIYIAEYNNIKSHLKIGQRIILPTKWYIENTMQKIK